MFIVSVGKVWSRHEVSSHCRLSRVDRVGSVNYASVNNTCHGRRALAKNISPDFGTTFERGRLDQTKLPHRNTVTRKRLCLKAARCSAVLIEIRLVTVAARHRVTANTGIAQRSASKNYTLF